MPRHAPPASAVALGLGLALALAACEPDRIDVDRPTGADGQRRSVQAAVNELRAAGHDGPAFHAFHQRLLALRPIMDEAAGEDAELFAVTEALAAVERRLAPGGNAQALALEVWPLALAPPLKAPVPGVPDPDVWSPWLPRAGEGAPAYLERLCGGLLALECKHVVPEGQAEVVAAVAIERLSSRARRAVINCPACVEASWRRVVAGWEAMNAVRVTTIAAARRTYDPARWPVAGAAAVPPPPAAPGLRHVHLGPEERVERLRYVLADARRDGVARIALAAREPTYPYRMRAYVLDSGLARLPARDGEPVQLLLRVLDVRAPIATTGATTGDGDGEVRRASRGRRR